MYEVTGATKSDPNTTMSQECRSPEALAQAVYRALLGGFKLPPLDDCEELRTALLTFEPSSLPSDNEDADVVNGNQANKSKGAEHGEEQTTLSREGHNNRAGPSREKGSRRKSPASSVLMLEALSRRRMDAVRQLHEACPQLLASIPLFDVLSPTESDNAGRVGGPSCPASIQQCQSCNGSLNYTRTDAVTYAVSRSSSVVLTANTCHLHRSSRLLDLAAENQTLLVFVLQHHPEVSKQHRHKGASRRDCQSKCTGSRAQMSMKCDHYDSIGPAHASSQYLVGDPGAQSSPTSSNTSAQKRNEHGMTERSELSGGTENKEEEIKEGESDLLQELDPNNPITVCIRKHNTAVLQYLLFKHVWQHFLLDEAFHLPHNSYVPEVHFGDLLHTCPECPWFVHCAALMGCPQLLQLLLSGHLCHHQFPWSPAVSSSSHVRAPLKADGNGSQENAGTKMTPFLECEEPCELIPDSKPDQNAESENLPPASNMDRNPENTAVEASDTEMKDDSSSPGTENRRSAPLPSIAHVFPASSIASPASNPSLQNSTGQLLKSSDCQVASTSCKPKRTVSAVSDVRSRSYSLSPQQQSLNLPDPNCLFPVSLPVMDRWISRCMHVRLTPLHLACWRCDPESIKVLIRHGADVRLLAEELLMPESSKEGQTMDPSTSQPQTDMVSSESSSVELNLNFVSVTVNSSSLDVPTVGNSMEEILKKAYPDRQGGLSSLAMLALGIRSPPDFSLSIGKSLGLVLPTLPEMWGGQVDRSCYQAKQLLLEAMGLLLEAGSDVNACCLVFGKSYRVLELFLQPSVDLYYAPLMPRGGRDSAVLRCMDLERVAEIVLSACWELCSRGGRLGPSFSSTMEWNLFRMDWMFLQNEALQRRFLHLAIFLGLFPPLDPELCGAGNAQRVGPRKATSSLLSREDSQSSVGPSAGGMDLREPHLPPYSLPPRPSCIPWAPSSMSRLPSSPPSSSDDRAQVDAVLDIQQPQDEATTSEVVTSYYSTAATQVTVSEARSLGAEDAELPLVEVISLELQPPHSDSSSGLPSSRNPSPSSPCLPASSAPQARRSTQPGDQATRAASPPPPPTATATAASPGPSSVMKAQMIRWGLEERQRRCLETFVNEAVRLSMPQSCAELVLRFLCLPDLHLLGRITQHMLQTSTSATENPLQRLHDTVCQAQLRTLQHHCKLATLLAVRWRAPAVYSLPLPDSLKRYLLDPH